MTAAEGQYQQPPFPPAGYDLAPYQLRQASNGRFWWSGALEVQTQRQGILIFDERQFEFFEAGEIICMMAFFLNDTALTLIKTCSHEFSLSHPTELDIVDVAAQAVARHWKDDTPNKA